MVDEGTRKTLSSIPLLKTKAGPRDKELWPIRLKEEYQTLIKYVQNNKDRDNDWFRLESNKDGTQWFGKCWHIHELMKYEFAIEFDIPVTYPLTAPEIAIPELDGKTAKMYRGGKICLTDHFKPLWGRNVPKFGIAQAMALGDTNVLGLDDKRKRSPSPESNSKRLRNESPVSRVLLECTICLQEVSNGMEFLPCGHCFHPDCIRSWFLTDRRKSCPICRNSFTTSVPEDDPIHGVDDSMSSTETISLDEASSDEETTSSENDSSDDSSSSDEYSRSVIALAVLTLCVVIRRRFR